MAKDSRLWEHAYDSYNKYIPNSKHNQRQPKAKVPISLSKEPMLLQEEYNNILAQIKALTRRRQAIKKEMKQFGFSPIKRSQYFDRPILLYALELQDNCWYIGMSRNVDRRYKAHVKGKTIWTSEHPPIKISEVRETGVNSDSEASKLEDEMTLEYARTYGTNLVRGGGYCQRKPVWPSGLL